MTYLSRILLDNPAWYERDQQNLLYLPQINKKGSMQESINSAMVDSITRISAGAAGIIGVENSDNLVQMVDQSGALLITHQPPHDWITPLIQGIIALVTIIFQWRSGRRKKSLNDQIRKY